MNEVLTYSKRRLQPFAGMAHLIESDAGRAITLDGELWQLQVATDTITRGWSALDPVGFSRGFVPYAYWSPAGVSRYLPINPSLDPARVRESGQELLGLVAQHHLGLPLPPGDPMELWLLDGWNRRPLALLASAVDGAGLDPRPDCYWQPFPLHQDEVPATNPEITAELSQFIRALEAQINRRAGSGRTVQWFRRQGDQPGLGLWGRHLPPELEGRELPASDFPSALLAEDWERPDENALVQRYQQLMAPRLLCLSDLPVNKRRQLEHAAWGNPQQVSRLYRLYPEVLDQQGLKTTLVRARLEQAARRQALG